jgi:hypothetical protein
VGRRLFCGELSEAVRVEPSGPRKWIFRVERLRHRTDRCPSHHSHYVLYIVLGLSQWFISEEVALPAQDHPAGTGAWLDPSSC